MNLGEIVGARMHDADIGIDDQLLDPGAACRFDLRSEVIEDGLDPDRGGASVTHQIGVAVGHEGEEEQRRARGDGIEGLRRDRAPGKVDRPGASLENHAGGRFAPGIDRDRMAAATEDPKRRQKSRLFFRIVDHRCLRRDGTPADVDPIGPGRRERLRSRQDLVLARGDGLPDHRLRGEVENAENPGPVGFAHRTSSFRARRNRVKSPRRRL